MNSEIMNECSSGLNYDGIMIPHHQYGADLAQQIGIKSNYKARCTVLNQLQAIILRTNINKCEFNYICEEHL